MKLFDMPSKKNHDRAPDKIGFSVALPKSLVAEIEIVAKAEHRSRNGQIEHFLAESVAKWKKEHPEDLGFVAEPQASYGVKVPPPGSASVPPKAPIPRRLF